MEDTSDPTPVAVRSKSRSQSPAFRERRSSRSPGRDGDASRDRLPQRPRGDRDSRRGRNNGPELRPGDLALRCLISTREAGIVIGKGGKNVKEIREQSGAIVSVSEHVPGVNERVVTVTGPLDQLAKGYSLIAYKINEELLSDEGTPTPEQVKQRPLSLRLLVPSPRMGSIIGKAGAKIKEIQEESGASCNASESPLPGSTDRIFTINGLVDSIHIATYYVAQALDAADKERGGPPPNQNPYRPGQFGGMPMPKGGHYNAGPVTTQQISVPADMVGKLIGKGGQKINEIRNMSGANIKIDNDSTGPEKIITISGNPQQNQAAVYLLYKRMETERELTRKLQQQQQ